MYYRALSIRITSLVGNWAPSFCRFFVLFFLWRIFKFTWSPLDILWKLTPPLTLGGWAESFSFRLNSPFNFHHQLNASLMEVIDTRHRGTESRWQPQSILHS